MATLARRRTRTRTAPAGGGTGRFGAGRARPLAHGARKGLWGVARVVSLITAIVVGLIVVGIVLVLLEANRDNAVVGWLLDAGAWLAQPFDNVFSLEGRKKDIAVNHGLAALIYAIVGGIVARLLRR